MVRSVWRRAAIVCRPCQTLGGSQDVMTHFSIDTRQAANQHLFSTVRVEIETDEGSGSGTAFFFRDTIEPGRSEEFLVTNNHVVEKARRAHIVFHTGPRYEANRLSIEREKRITFDDFPSLWTRHPDETIDLCAVRLSRLKERAAGELEQLFFIPMGSHGVPEPDEEARYPTVLTVAMIGYPSGLWDKAHNLPIFRRGTTASHPAVDFNGKAEVVIDMACFPGSSGSPVIFDDRNWFASAHRFLGVLHEGPTITNKGERFASSQFRRTSRFMWSLGQ